MPRQEHSLQAVPHTRGATNQQTENNMDKQELISVLSELASKDLADHSDINDHPCMVAVRAINQCFDDIAHLQQIVSSGAGPKSKRSVYLSKLPYNPKW